AYTSARCLYLSRETSRKSEWPLPPLARKRSNAASRFDCSISAGSSTSSSASTSLRRSSGVSRFACSMMSSTFRIAQPQFAKWYQQFTYSARRTRANQACGLETRRRSLQKPANENEAETLTQPAVAAVPPLNGQDLDERENEPVLALGKLARALRHIEKATGVRQQTARAYPRAAGIAVCNTSSAVTKLPRRISAW